MIVIMVLHARQTDIIGSVAAWAFHQRGARSHLINGPLAVRRGFRLERRIRQSRIRVNK